ncbi:hypothetical protein GCM10011576_46960 [Micromonospora parathelypteridis]|nr:hypothetical protein GCM10011576_46960 [Micromonospora parathelypteridis]
MIKLTVPSATTLPLTIAIRRRRGPTSGGSVTGRETVDRYTSISSDRRLPVSHRPYLSESAQRTVRGSQAWHG